MAQIDYMKLYLENRNKGHEEKVKKLDAQIDIKLTDPPPYQLYEIESAKLEARIEEMRALKNPPKTLAEGLLFLGVPITLA